MIHLLQQQEHVHFRAQGPWQGDFDSHKRNDFDWVRHWFPWMHCIKGKSRAKLRRIIISEAPYAIAPMQSPHLKQWDHLLAVMQINTDLHIRVDQCACLLFYAR